MNLQNAIANSASIIGRSMPDLDMLSIVDVIETRSFYQLVYSAREISLSDRFSFLRGVSGNYEMHRDLAMPVFKDIRCIVSKANGRMEFASPGMNENSSTELFSKFFAEMEAESMERFLNQPTNGLVNRKVL